MRRTGDQVCIRVVSADIWGSLRLLNDGGIEIFALELEDALTCSFRLHRRQLPDARRLLEKRGDSVRVCAIAWRYAFCRSLLQRPVLYSGLLLLTLFSFFLPTRILSVQVEGNGAVPTGRILEAAQSAGIRLFAPCARVRSERMKNALLSELPELQWAGVNTYGCRAVISVRERAPREPVPETHAPVSSIIASRDGIVESVTALRGTALCQPGQGVKKGQVLISGYTDCGIALRASRAEGEVYAQTLHTVRAAAPAYQLSRSEITHTRRSFTLVIGKKRINLWKDSGIPDITCGRIEKEYRLTLPGGFSLPVSLVCQTRTQYAVEETGAERETAERELAVFAEKYLLSQMIAGRVSYCDEVMETPPGVYLLTGQFLCTEMIGRERLETGE